MKRGEVRLHVSRPQDKQRPVVIVTRQGALAYLTAVVVAPISSTVRYIPSGVYLDQADGLPPRLAQLRHSTDRSGQRSSSPWAMRIPERLAELEQAVRFALGCECPGE